MVGVMLRLSLFVVVVAACTERNPRYCDRDSDCKELPFTFCDLNGEYPESGHTVHTCTTTPATCPIERCGCQPGTPLTCDVDQLSVCAEDGRSSTASTCPLGCSTAEPRCLTFEPSNGLGPALEMAAGEPDVAISSNARIDTDLGLIQDASGGTVTVTSMTVSLANKQIRAFIGKSIVLDRVTVTGSLPVAFVASTSLTVRGVVDVGATARVNGPGAQSAPAGCAGAGTLLQPSSVTTPGAGGGGNATAGAVGGNNFMPGAVGGSALTEFVPLLGGCRGGDLLSGAAVVSGGGGGGGAVQLVAGAQILFTGAGGIDVGGGGGEPSAGGGSGGVVVLEAPVVRMEGATTGVYANGGAGGGRATVGSDGLATGVAAPGTDHGGNGGTALIPPVAGLICAGTCILGERKGGGGGAAGRLQVSTRPAGFDQVGQPVISAVVTQRSLVVR